MCSNPLNLKDKITKRKQKKIFCSPSKMLKNISWPISICLKYFMTLTKTLWSPSHILNVRSLNQRFISGIFIVLEFHSPGGSKSLLFNLSDSLLCYLNRSLKFFCKYFLTALLSNTLVFKQVIAIWLYLIGGPSYQ